MVNMGIELRPARHSSVQLRFSALLYEVMLQNSQYYASENLHGSLVIEHPATARPLCCSVLLQHNFSRVFLRNFKL